MISAPRRCTSLRTIAAVWGLILVTWTNQQRWVRRKGTWTVLRTSSSSSLRRRRRQPWPSPLCLPRNFHLSPASNVQGDSLKANMTLSFTVPLDCQQWVPWISYGRVSPPPNLFDDNDDPPHHHPRGPSTTLLPNTTVPTTESVQFSFSSYRRRHYQSSRIYHAILPDIQAGSIPYWYQVNLLPHTKQQQHQHQRRQQQTSPDSWVPQQSDMFHFLSPPLPLEPVRLALIADWGSSEEAIKTMQGMLRRTGGGTMEGQRPPLSAVVVAGDISYANANLPLWEDFLNKMEPLFSTIPLLVAPGNHEIECNRDNFQVFQAYEYYFRVPNRQTPVRRLPIPSQRLDCTHPAEFQTVYEYGNSFYSYRHGMVYIIVLNSYTNTTKGSEQYNWLENELSTNVDRTWTPWLLVVFHCPLHTTFRGHNDEQNPRLMMQDMEPLFVKYQVNVVLSGHNHAYVRSYPMIGSKRSGGDDDDDDDDDDSRAPIYFTIGTGGDSHSQGPLHPDQPAEPWVAHRDNREYGFGEFTVVNTTHASFQRILNRGDQALPSSRDDVWIRNHYDV